MEPTKGFVLVASRKPNFYKFALNLMEAIRDYYEDANICFVTEERFLEERGKDLADKIVFCDDHYRAKLWGMTQSPYDITMYIDVDMNVEHEDIATVFDELKGADIRVAALTEDRSYAYAEWTFNDPEGRQQVFKYCGGVFLYDRRNPLVREFVNDWWILTRKQMDNEWWPEGYPRSLSGWDQFSLWWLTEKVEKYKDLKIEIFEDDLRWNYYNAYNMAITKPENPVVLRHYSSGLDKDGYLI